MRAPLCPRPRGAAAARRGLCVRAHAPRVCAWRSVAAEDARPRRAGAAPGRAEALRGPAAPGSNGEASAAPANYISGTSIIRGKTRKRWRPAPGGPLPEQPGPSLLLLTPPPRGAPAPPRPRRDPDPGPTGGHSARQPQAEHSRLFRGCAWWPDSKWDRRTRRLAVSSALQAAGPAGDSPPLFSPCTHPSFAISLNFGEENNSGLGGWGPGELHAWGTEGGDQCPRREPSLGP